jgi:acetate kinase
MNEAILTLNAGSSSIKFALFVHAAEVPMVPEIAGQIDGIGVHAHLKIKDKAGHTLADMDDVPGRESSHHGALTLLLDWLHEHQASWRIVAVGHRVVHGAAKYSQPVRIDAAVLAALESLYPLAPLHQPHNVAGIKAMADMLDGVPQVACFDTAFHTSHPPLAQLFALPRRITAEGVRRYGFHGLSYEYIAHVLPKHLDDRASGKVVVAHLGNGASLCAMAGLKSQASSMGFTAVDGLMMGTRTGSIDPGVLLYLMENHGMDAAALTRLLYKESGLLGVSGISQDMRELLASEAPEAREAVDLFCYRLVREVGAMAAALEGIDALVFTGSIGENSAPIREKVCNALGWIGVDFDATANDGKRRVISRPDSKVAVLVLPTNEEWMIARHSAHLLHA